MIDVAERGVGLIARGLGLRYGSVRALESIDLRLEAGEQVALVGPSGAGKSSLLRALASAAPPTEGSVEIGGQELSTLKNKSLRALRSSVGFVHQDLGLVPTIRVVQNVMAGRFGRQSLWGSLRAFLVPTHGALSEAYALLDRVSGGQQQRVAIARALYQRPAVLLADEPVSSVDPARAEHTIRLLTEVCNEEGITLFVSLHSLELARAFFPRIVGLRAGRVAFDRPTEQVKNVDLEGLYRLGGAAGLAASA